MIKVFCNFCNEELQYLGALLFSPPSAEGKCDKLHVYVSCYVGLFNQTIPHKILKKVYETAKDITISSDLALSLIRDELGIKVEEK